ncbi:MAG: c-type cytochrome, partial [Isosphaeraceae bacterium]
MTRALANLVFTAMVIWVTYFVTMMLMNRPPAPQPVPENVRIATQRTQELRAEERRLLTTYGPPGPTSVGYRIPIDRAMELSAAEGGRPHLLPSPMPATVAPGTSTPAAPVTGTPGASVKSPAAGTPMTPAPAAVATAAAPAAASNGMPPQQLFLAVCFACHGPDGRGTTVRAAMPVIPDFTDPKWQASRTDADLTHSILTGKGQLMLPMKDKLELAHTDVKDMVAYIRSFKAGGAGTMASTPTAGSP